VNDREQQLWATISFEWSDHLEGSEEYKEDVRLDLFSLWELTRIVQDLGPTRAMAFAQFAVTIAHLHPNVENPSASTEEGIKIASAVHWLSGLFIRKREPRDLEDQVIDFTYHLMREKVMSREAAATFASLKLGATSTDAYRKKVDRWVVSNDLPPLGQTKRRSRKEVSGRN
jgi:hypothetical protein